MEDIKEQQVSQETAAVVATETETKPETITEPVKIKLGSKEFKNLEEANAWASQLEQSVGKQGKELGDLRGRLEKPKAAEIVVEDSDEDDPRDIRELEDKFYTDFPSALKMIEARVEKKLGRKLKQETLSTVQAHDTRNAVWDAFFERYPQYMTNRDRIERYVENVLWKDVTDIEKVEAQFSFIDNELRAFGLSAKLASAEDLPKGRPFAETGTSTKSPAPAIKAEETIPKTSSFLEELSGVLVKR